MTTAAEFQAKVDKANTNLDRLDGIVNGDNSALVGTDHGNVPSVAKVMNDITTQANTLLTTKGTAFDTAIADAQAASDRFGDLADAVETVAALADDGTIAAIPGNVTAAQTAKTDAEAARDAAEGFTATAEGIAAGAIYQIVSTVSALRGIDASVAAATPNAFLRSYSGTLDDGAEGFFIYNSADTRADNGGTIFKPHDISSGAGRWNRVFRGPLHDLWFGVVADTTTDTVATDNSAALQAVEDAADALNIRAIYYPPKAAGRGYKTTITTYPKIKHFGLIGDQQGDTVTNGSLLRFRPTTSTDYGFEMTLPNGINAIQSPTFFDLNFDGDNFVKLNDPANGFTDTSGSQQYLINVVVKNCKLQAFNFNTSGTTAIQVSKGRQCMIRGNTFLGFDRAVHLEGIDEVMVAHNSMQGGIQSLIYGVSHGTFGNDLTIYKNFMASLADGGDAFIDVGYRSCVIEENFLEGAGTYTTLINLSGGFTARVNSNELSVDGTVADSWLHVAPGYHHVSAFDNTCMGSLASLRAKFDTDAGYPYYATDGSRVKVRHGGNFAANGDIGFPFNTVASSLDAGHLPPGVLARFTPNLDGLNYGAYGQTVLCKNGAFILTSTGSSNYLEFSNTDFPALGETVDLWVLAVQPSGGPGSLSGALLDYATGTPTSYGTITVPSNVTWLKVKSGTDGSYSKGCRIYSGVAGLLVFEAALVKQSYPTS